MFHSTAWGVPNTMASFEDVLPGFGTYTNLLVSATPPFCLESVGKDTRKDVYLTAIQV